MRLGAPFAPKYCRRRQRYRAMAVHRFGQRTRRRSCRARNRNRKANFLNQMVVVQSKRYPSFIAWKTSQRSRQFSVVTIGRRGDSVVPFKRTDSVASERLNLEPKPKSQLSRTGRPPTGQPECSHVERPCVPVSRDTNSTARMRLGRKSPTFSDNLARKIKQTTESATVPQCPLNRPKGAWAANYF